MKKKLRSVWLATALLVCGLSASQAAVPGTLTYQGKLTNSSGSPVNGTVSIVFAIYGISTGGTALWSETQNSVNVASGIFTVTLGSVTPIPSTVFSNTDIYIGIKVGADFEMTPRQKLNSVPFAIKAGEADKVIDKVYAYVPSSTTVDCQPWTDVPEMIATVTTGNSQILVIAKGSGGSQYINSDTFRLLIDGAQVDSTAISYGGVERIPFLLSWIGTLSSGAHTIKVQQCAGLNVAHKSIIVKEF